MKREELNEERLEEINGGEYQVYNNDTGELLGSYKFRGSMQKAVDALNGAGVNLKVCTTNWMDDKGAEKVYPADKGK